MAFWRIKGEHNPLSGNVNLLATLGEGEKPPYKGENSSPRRSLYLNKAFTS